MSTFATSQEIAEHFNVPHEHVLAWIATGQLVGYKNPPGTPLGYKITDDVLIPFLKEKKMPLGKWGTTVVLMNVEESIASAMAIAAEGKMFFILNTCNPLELGMFVGKGIDCVITPYLGCDDDQARQLAEAIHRFPPCERILMIAFVSKGSTNFPKDLFESFLEPDFDPQWLIEEITSLVAQRR